MLQCPVCQFENAEEATACQQCGWAFTYYLNLTPEDEITYKTQLTQAQAKWQAIQNPAKPAPTTPIAVPDLTQDVFESEEEFKQRIEKQNPYFAGTATLLREQYDAQKEIFPLTVQWQSWLSPASRGLYVKVDRLSAKQLYEQNSEHAIYIQLTVKEGLVVITKLSVQCETNSYLIHQEEDDQVWTWTQQYDSAEAYQQYLNSQTLKTHYLDAKKRLKHKQLETKRAEIKTIALHLTLAIIGTTVGTMATIQWIGTLSSALLGGVVGAVFIVGASYWILLWITELRCVGSNTLYSLEILNGKRLMSQHASVSREKYPQLSIQGWAVDEVAKRAAAGVLVCIDNVDTLALYGKERADVVRNWNNVDYQYSGFSAVVDIQKLSKGEHQIRLKIITADKKGYYMPDKAFTLLIL